jgi:hypothetical protein
VDVATRWQVALERREAVSKLPALSAPQTLEGNESLRGSPRRLLSPGESDSRSTLTLEKEKFKVLV